MVRLAIPEILAATGKAAAAGQGKIRQQLSFALATAVIFYAPFPAMHLAVLVLDLIVASIRETLVILAQLAGLHLALVTILLAVTVEMAEPAEQQETPVVLEIVEALDTIT